MVTPGKKIADLVDLTRVKVKLSVPEKDIVGLRPGQPAVMTLDASPSARYEGTVSAVGAKSESSTGHTYPVEVTIASNGAAEVKAGMFARVTITSGIHQGAVSIPREWILNEDTAPAVFVAHNGVARETAVTIASRNGGMARLASGLTPGDLVASFGQKSLVDGAPISIAK